MNFLASFGIFFLFASCIGAPTEDLVSNLPGLNFPINYEQYSGYLNASNERKYHYWLTESQSDPANDPLILWLNGGPGCSSLLGFLTELGPFYVDQSGTGELHPNPYSWNTKANVVFLESPACVGFSYDTTGKCRSSDNSTAEENYAALQDFFTNKFPEYRNKKFFITGESYAGVYIPTLTKLIIDGNDTFPLNFQGFAIGNGYFDVRVNTNSMMFFAYYHAVLGDHLWNNMTRFCCDEGEVSSESCNFYNGNLLELSPECLTYVDEATLRIDASGLNPYNLYSQCGELAAGNASEGSRSAIERRLIYPHLRNEESSPSTQDVIDIDTYDPACSNNEAEINWLNDPATKAALNIAEEADDWKPCSNVVNLEYNQIYYDLVDVIAYNANHSRGLIFNGDVDMVCNVMGNEWSIERLALPILEDRRKWFADDGQIAGYVKKFENNLDFVTVKGAGHMVPGYKPPEALHMIMSFIDEEPY